jgi:hypothetical protein
LILSPAAAGTPFDGFKRQIDEIEIYLERCHFSIPRAKFP